MKEYPNFYETLAEAHIRLRGTIVLYDGKPKYVAAITNHKGDGIFRVYLTSIVMDPEKRGGALYPSWIDDYNPQDSSLGEKIDAKMEKDDTFFLRKTLNSPLFNRFRPFPLGMCNITGQTATYVERQPARKTEQGLIRQMLMESPVNEPAVFSGIQNFSIYSKDFEDCILGKYPSAEQCRANLLDPVVNNKAVAFHREFALSRGPLDMLLLTYKDTVVGLLPNRDFSVLQLAKKHGHVYEAAEDLKLFGKIATI